MIWKLITCLFFVPALFAMEERDTTGSKALAPPIQTYVPSASSLKPPKYSEIQQFEKWIIDVAVKNQAKKFAIPVEEVYTVFNVEGSPYTKFCNFFKEKKPFHAPQKIFNEKALKDNLNSFKAVVIEFSRFWLDTVAKFEDKLESETSYESIIPLIFKAIDTETKKNFKLYQRLTTIYYYHYTTYMGKRDIPFCGLIPELMDYNPSNIAYFSDQNGYLFSAYDSGQNPLMFKPLLFGENAIIPGIGCRGMLIKDTTEIIRQSGWFFDKMVVPELLKFHYVRGESDPYPFYHKIITFAESDQEIRDEEVFTLPTPLYQKLRAFLNVLQPNSGEALFIPIPPEESNDALFCDYLFIESLKNQLLEEDTPLLLTTAYWVLEGTGADKEASLEDVIEKLSDYQKGLEEKLMQSYEEEIRAEQEAVMKKHTYEVYKQPQRKKRPAKAKNRKHSSTEKPAVQQTNSEEEIKQKAKLYFQDNLQKARVTYKDLCKMTHKMIKDVFKDHQELFSKTISGSHVNIHIEGGEGVTLVKKHGGGRKDLTYPARFANNYMARLLKMGIIAFESQHQK